MPKICYQDMNISGPRLGIIQNCNDIIGEYQAEGLVLTLRQLFYQLVSRDFIPNTVQEYKRLGDIVNDARMAGLMDWSAIEDRTRELSEQAHWNSPSSILEACASQFRTDRWANQSVYVEVWVEKEALAGVFERACKPLDVPLFCCRGYTSQSEMWGAGQRFVRKMRAGKKVVILHFGDHDPSGIDMTRDINDRLHMFTGHHILPKLEVRRLALNMDQVEEFNPPENPAKTTDSRFASYEAQFGDKSWELDALNPKTLNQIVKAHVQELADMDLFREAHKVEATHRASLQIAADRWGEVSGHLEDTYPDELEANRDEALRDISDEADLGVDEDTDA